MRHIKSSYEVRGEQGYSKTRNIQAQNKKLEVIKLEERLKKRYQELNKQLKSK
jgi:hypothetical protein